MTSRHYKGHWILLASAAFAVGPANANAPLGTAFIYQGRLVQSGAPADGTYDFEFRLFLTDAGGSPIGAVVCADDVDVAAGLFTVSLDFGSAFDGNQRFLEVAVRADTIVGNCDDGTFATLSPRQPLTAARPAR